jgi:hypothetical protein
LKHSFALLILVAMPCLCQTTSTGNATSSGPCSPANTGNKNTFTIKCGIDQKQGQEMLSIMNKILANQLDTNAVMTKLDEILKAVNPNLPAKVYLCDGSSRTLGPTADSALTSNYSIAPDPSFQEMISLHNSGNYKELLNVCLAQMQSNFE